MKLNTTFRPILQMKVMRHRKVLSGCPRNQRGRDGAGTRGSLAPEYVALSPFAFAASCCLFQNSQERGASVRKETVHPASNTTFAQPECRVDFLPPAFAEEAELFSPKPFTPFFLSGCAGSSRLATGSPQLQWAGGYSLIAVHKAAHCGGFPCCGVQAPRHVCVGSCAVQA